MLFRQQAKKERTGPLLLSAPESALRSLPSVAGDNADDGTEEQYRLIRRALDRLKLPVQIIPGDRDRKTGTLDAHRRYLEPELYRGVTLRGFRLLFLNAVDSATPDSFDFSHEQIGWLESQLIEARSARLRPVVFTHLYPSELATQADAFTRLIREFGVELVEMGHTHYSELANDDRTIYATTRSTGQIEEGPPGFSITSIDGDVVSWKFKERGSWPFIMITSLADEKLIIKPESTRHVVRGVVQIRARVWGAADLQSVTCTLGEARARPMEFHNRYWEINWNMAGLPDGIHRHRSSSYYTHEQASSRRDQCPLQSDWSVSATEEKLHRL